MYKFNNLFKETAEKINTLIKQTTFHHYLCIDLYLNIAQKLLIVKPSIYMSVTKN